MPYKRGKIWQGQVRFKNPETDSYDLYRKSGFATKTSASEWEKNKLKKLEVFYSNAPENWPLYELVLKYMAAQKLQLEQLEDGEDKKAFASGWKYYREKKNTLNRFVECMAKTMPISTITPDAVYNYMSGQVAAGRSHNAANKDKKHIMGMFTWFETTHRKVLNPARVVADFTHTEKTRYTPPIDDVLTLLKTAKAEDLEVYFFLLLYLSTGARRAELFRLKWVIDVDFKRLLIRLGSRKNKRRVVKYEWVPMPADARLALTHFHNTRLSESQEYVLVIKHINQFQGQPYTERNKLMQRWCKKAGVRRFGYHAMRRVYIQTLGESGQVGANQLRMLARHSSLGTTSKYSHTPDPALHNAAHNTGLAALEHRAQELAAQAVPAQIIPIEEKRRKKVNGS